MGFGREGREAFADEDHEFRRRCLHRADISRRSVREPAPEIWPEEKLVEICGRALEHMHGFGRGLF